MGILKNLYNSANEGCIVSILDLLEINPNHVFLDVGCWDGTNTLRFANKIQTKNIFGIEIDEEGLKKAEEKEINVTNTDLNKMWNFKDNSVDVIIANQVIEHLYNTDNFVKELKRILKPEGYAIISTNNLSSWHNFIPLLLGYQPFPNDISGYKDIGKLFSLENNWTSSFSHLRIFSYCALKDFFNKYEFKIENHVGIGYYPFPQSIGKIFNLMDPRHSVYQTIKVRKRLT
ncbi:MAG TPA: methyltransferase domain-containing protein [Methanofastidiosum sp.]|nr:methyltransferase domain-containing protein [Methanofastidiosum sp.]